MRHYEVPTRFEQDVYSRRPSVVTILIVINIAMFITQRILIAFADVNLERFLALRPQEAIHQLKAWQFLTYMFLHSYDYFAHIFFNILGLYIFGRELEWTVGRTKFLTLYLSCGIYAGLMHALVGYLSDRTAVSVIGASGAIYGIMVTYVLTWPARPMLFFFIVPMKAWHCVMIFIGIDLLYALTDPTSGVAHFAHLGGALAAYLITKLEPGVERVVHRWETRSARKHFLEDFELRREVDLLLDKINQHGIASLTPRERTLLNKASKRLSQHTTRKDGHE